MTHFMLYAEIIEYIIPVRCISIRAVTCFSITRVCRGIMAVYMYSHLVMYSLRLFRTVFDYSAKARVMFIAIYRNIYVVNLYSKYHHLFYTEGLKYRLSIKNIMSITGICVI